MNRGYTLLWRKIWSNPLLCEPGKKFSRLEAWLYLTNVQAAGMDDEKSGLKRGEFGAARDTSPGNGTGPGLPCRDFSGNSKRRE